ncbi:MAG TPA: hypothetical protein VF180_14300 [Acidimicrobiia bacterium]
MSIPVPRPMWLKITAVLAVAGAVAWPVLVMLAIVGVIPAQAVLNVGIITAFLAYISIRRIKHDRAIAMGATPQADSPQPPPEEMP